MNKTGIIILALIIVAVAIWYFNGKKPHLVRFDNITGKGYDQYGNEVAGATLEDL